VLFFFMEKRFAVSDEVLEISQLWPVDCGEIGFGDDAPENGEPDSAAARIGRSNALFVAVCPTGFETGPITIPLARIINKIRLNGAVLRLLIPLEKAELSKIAREAHPNSSRGAA